MPGSSGLGKGRPGKSGSGVDLVDHHGRRRQAGPLERGPGHVGTHAVEGRVRDTHVVGVGHEAHRRHVGQVGLDRRAVEMVDQRRVRRGQDDGGGRPHGVDAGGDLGVDGRHDLAALGQIHLVAVVVAGVVAGRHHHAGGGAQLGDGKGQHRCRHRVGHDPGPDPGPGQDSGGVGGEHVALAPGVVADHDPAPGGVRVGVEQPPGQPRRGPADHHPVHAHRSGAELAPEARRAELQPAPEAGGQLLAVAGGQEGAQLVPGVRIGIVGQPRFRGGRQLVGHGRDATTAAPGTATP